MSGIPEYNKAHVSTICLTIYGIFDTHSIFYGIPDIIHRQTKNQEENTNATILIKKKNVREDKNLHLFKINSLNYSIKVH